jgi:methylenetetrahydrofolate reductase (NADPH)
VDRYAHNPAALRQAAVVYAAEQIIDLYANGINAVHVYSMNKPDVARDIQTMVSEIIR